MMSGCASKESESKNSGEKGSAITETQMGNRKDDSSKKSKVNIGDYVLFGSYEQDNDTTNGAEPIEWQVVDIDNDKALLVSKYILDNVEYNEPEGIYGDGDSECKRCL